MDFEKGVLGNTIHTARMENHLSQEELAELIGITPTHLKHLESEHRKPSIDVLFHLAKVLHFSLDHILFQSEDCQSKQIREIENLMTDCSPAELNIIQDLLRSLQRNRPIS